MGPSTEAPRLRRRNRHNGNFAMFATWVELSLLGNTMTIVNIVDCVPRVGYITYEESERQYSVGPCVISCQMFVIS